MGQLPPGSITLVETLETSPRLAPADERTSPIVTQTTLSVDDTREMVEALQGALPAASSARTRKTSATPPPTARRR